MFLIGVVGIIILIWMAVQGLWKLIPWLIVAVVVTSIIGFVLEHLLIIGIIFSVLAFFLLIGLNEERKEKKQKNIDQKLSQEKETDIVEDSLESDVPSNVQNTDKKDGYKSTTIEDEEIPPAVTFGIDYRPVKKSVLNTTQKIKQTDSPVDSFVVFDIETTGLKKTDSVIQLSAIKVINDEIAERFNTFVNPHTPIPENIIYLTGIKEGDVMDAPEISDVLSDFSSFIGELPLVGHNIVRFDLPLLLDKGLILNNNCVIDTVRLSTILLPNLKNHKLPTLKKYFGINDISHNAFNDCQTNLKVYIKLRNNELEPKIAEEIVLDNKLEGLRLSVTGQFMGVSRNDIISSIKSHGGRYTKGVSGKTNYLIVGKQVDKRSIEKDHSMTELKALDLINSGSDLQIINIKEYKQLIV